MKNGSNHLGATEPQATDLEDTNNEVSNAMVENKQNTIEFLEEELETEEVSLENEDDDNCLSPNVANSVEQIISHIGIIIEDDHNQNTEMNVPVGGLELPLPGAYHVPGAARLPRGVHVLISAVSENITGDTIDNAFVVDDDTVIIPEQEKKPKFYLILFISVAVNAAVIVTLLLTYVPESAAKTTNIETVQNDLLHNDTQATIDDFIKIIIETNISSIEDLMNSSSPQSKALLWMTDEKRTTFLLEGLMLESLIQRYVSVVFYYSLNGGNWSNQYSFLAEGLSECKWGDDMPHLTFNDGINCNMNGTISRITLSNNSLSGTIPSEVGHLSTLSHLNLIDNDISGTIPSSIGKIDALYLLNLSFNNRLTGTIPTSLANLTNLAILGVANPNLLGFEDFCPLLEGRNIILETYYNESQLIHKEGCDEYTRLQYCQILKEKLFQCCPSNPTSSSEKCYDPALLLYLY